jgi:hypothetical protein
MERRPSRRVTLIAWRKVDERSWGDIEVRREDSLMVVKLRKVAVPQQ